ncbi:uncharacterized protein LOC119903408 isoform X2 [Micropterus salmoides]|uniref:uncharacterized protein LOC119903408 isoform X2 n=1 Tax=Micropterus salmoides TaxID=27706 RepID=UPI0018EA3800|nr:uncharacterized protein LOC119903408 isoform X2 [Micropterus salmoides]
MEARKAMVMDQGLVIIMVMNMDMDTGLVICLVMGILGMGILGMGILGMGILGMAILGMGITDMGMGITDMGMGITDMGMARSTSTSMVICMAIATRKDGLLMGTPAAPAAATLTR